MAKPSRKRSTQRSAKRMFASDSASRTLRRTLDDRDMAEACRATSGICGETHHPSSARRTKAFRSIDAPLRDGRDFHCRLRGRQRAQMRIVWFIDLLDERQEHRDQTPCAATKDRVPARLVYDLKRERIRRQ